MVTLRRGAVGDYYVTMACEIEQREFPPSDERAGLDLGLRDVVTTSDGWKSGNPRFIRKLQRKLRSCFKNSF